MSDHSGRSEYTLTRLKIFLIISFYINRKTMTFYSHGFSANKTISILGAIRDEGLWGVVALWYLPHIQTPHISR